MLTKHKSQKSLFSITHSICVGGLKILVSFELFQEIVSIIGWIEPRAYCKPYPVSEEFKMKTSTQHLSKANSHKVSNDLAGIYQHCAN